MHRISEIAEALGLAFEGDGDLRVSGVAEPAGCPPDKLAMALKPEFAAGLAQGEARAAMMWAGADWSEYGLAAAILAPRPRFAMAGLSALMDPGQGLGGGISDKASVDPSATLGQDVSVGAFTVIAPGAQIGDGTVIGPQCWIGPDAVLGAGSLLHAGVRIGARVRIGQRFIAQPGVVVGGDGFSFVTPEVSGVERARQSLGDQGEVAEQSWARIHSLGAVEIGDDVEIGANSCVDRGTVRDTRIGEGTKLDNLVQVGHNVIVGRHCLLCAQVGVAGSSTIGDHTVLGGQTGVGDNLRIGSNVITGGATKVLANVPDGRVMLGYPAMKMDTHIEAYKNLRRLPRLFRDVARLRKTVSNSGESD
ncbi:UDP-3-O-(3-hydroxymyristoyl)glucosamine N-acyltransferase [Litorisediminicola beolgyonensis]|uniref:UDP-3-O-acylglucosamine N-acyltransferase n=1 Tax=Litorisediminicola beolgyonensis TaxID=1173614 RepID=A0ABW3ZG44_9RHOB